MKVKYKNKVFDIIIFTAYQQAKSPILQIFFLGFAIYMFWVGYDIGKYSWYHALASSLYYVSILIVVQLVFNILYIYTSGKFSSFATEHTIEISDDCLYEETEYNKSYFYWHGIRKVIKSAGFIYIYVAPNMAHLIPKSVFENKRDMDEFYIKCKGYIDSGKPN